MKRKEIETYLPGVFQRTASPGSLLFAFLETIEALHTPSEDVLINLDSFFDPYRTPDHFAPFLASFVDLDQIWIEDPSGHTATSLPAFPGGIGRLRELIAAASHLSKWRGTRRGLLLFLELATGIQGIEIEEWVPGAEGKPIPFHLRISIPDETVPYRAMIERIIELEKPAYVTYELRTGKAEQLDKGE
ncbi:MAG: hypothetical protein GTO18_11110 [Anaerolineales bacterium]|nr:hypothetical protein [Anaerolineales bacterium]